MKTSKIIKEIEDVVRSLSNGVYTAWTIGRADDVEDSRIEHGDPENWMAWDADSVDAARNIESYFAKKGMRQEGGEIGTADYVFIYTF